MAGPPAQGSGSTAALGRKHARPRADPAPGPRGDILICCSKPTEDVVLDV